MRALTWNSGSAAKNVELRFSGAAAATDQASTTSMPWVCAASFGAPVVPPVWKNAARSCGPGGSSCSVFSSAAATKSWRYSTLTPATGRSGTAARCSGRVGRRASNASRWSDSATEQAMSQPAGEISGPAAIRTLAPAPRSSSVTCAGPRAGLTGAAIAAACAASIAGTSPATFGESRPTASVRRTPSNVRLFAIRCTSLSSSRKVTSTGESQCSPSGSTTSTVCDGTSRADARSASYVDRGRRRAASGTASMASRSAGPA